MPAITGVTLERYSEKSHILKGNTHPIKEDLKKLGCMWLPSQAGWIAGDAVLDVVQRYIDTGEVNAELAEKRIQARRTAVSEEKKRQYTRNKSLGLEGVYELPYDCVMIERERLQQLIERIRELEGQQCARTVTTKHPVAEEVVEEVEEIEIESDSEDERPPPRRLLGKR